MSFKKPSLPQVFDPVPEVPEKSELELSQFDDFEFDHDARIDATGKHEFEDPHHSFFAPAEPEPKSEFCAPEKLATATKNKANIALTYSTPRPKFKLGVIKKLVKGEWVIFKEVHTKGPGIQYEKVEDDE